MGVFLLIFLVTFIYFTETVDVVGHIIFMDAFESLLFPSNARGDIKTALNSFTSSGLRIIRHRKGDLCVRPKVSPFYVICEPGLAEQNTGAIHEIMTAPRLLVLAVKKHPRRRFSFKQLLAPPLGFPVQIFPRTEEKHSA